MCVDKSKWKLHFSTLCSRTGELIIVERPHPATWEPTKLLPAFHLMQPARDQPWSSRPRHGWAWSGCSPCTRLWPGTLAPCQWVSGQKLQQQRQKSGATSPCRCHPPLAALRTLRKGSTSFILSLLDPFLNDRATCGYYPAHQTWGLLCG